MVGVLAGKVGDGAASTAVARTGRDAPMEQVGVGPVPPEGGRTVLAPVLLSRGEGRRGEGRCGLSGVAAAWAGLTGGARALEMHARVGAGIAAGNWIDDAV